ncbi:MAG TPA: sodium:solute symporter family protein [Verrucomicrobiae bacterium]|nr:sodium:solute symporter family protein [Verrucomicrobiae bacterium]
MKLHAIDIAIIVGYFLLVLLIGLWVSRRGSKDLDSYFLGGRSLRWHVLGISDASGMFDISGTMWLVFILFVYGLKSLWLPWLWPVFNQIFLMMFLSAWLRRSNVLTGAEWIQTRFGRGRGANLAHLSVVFFALVNVIGMLAYAFKGIGKFAVVMLPWQFTGNTAGLFTDENIYAMIILGLTSLYAIKGGMVSVVITEVMQFTILTITALAIAVIAMVKVSPEMIQAAIPAGWMNPFFGLRLELDWTGILDKVNNVIRTDGNELFGIVFGLMFFKGILASLAGPAPNYDMQRILATRNPREACMMNGMVNVALYFPRYAMITGITILALAFCMPELRAMEKPDFEKLLPIVLSQYIPAGVVGLLLAGLLAALMSNFAATLNAAPAYLVNDIYKRFFDPTMAPKAQVFWSRVASVGVLLVGTLFGLLTTSITEVMMWIVGALYGGYVMANVLKWYWWRFNGYGYFWGMMAGILSAMFMPEVARLVLGHPISNPLFLFPIIFGLSVAGCLLGTFLSKAEDDSVLKNFYKTVNPWGAWGPIRAKVVAENPSFIPNPDFAKDMTNVAVGIVWQLSLTALPIFIVLRSWKWAGVVGALLAVTSVFIKLNWYDRLEKAGPTPAEPAPRPAHYSSAA